MALNYTKVLCHKIYVLNYILDVKNGDVRDVLQEDVCELKF